MFQVAFGKIGLEKECFWGMTPREFFNAWHGWAEAENERLKSIRNMIYGASRFNASSTAFSKDQSKRVARYRFPWEKSHSKEAMSGDVIAKMLNFIAKPENQN